jgi:hypothetical protein
MISGWQKHPNLAVPKNKHFFTKIQQNISYSYFNNTYPYHQRLQFHQDHSGPVMEEFHQWLKCCFGDKNGLKLHTISFCDIL